MIHDPTQPIVNDQNNQIEEASGGGHPSAVTAQPSALDSSLQVPHHAIPHLSLQSTLTSTGCLAPSEVLDVV